jgi:hypothetical protein
MENGQCHCLNGAPSSAEIHSCDDVGPGRSLFDVWSARYFARGMLPMAVVLMVL